MEVSEANVEESIVTVVRLAQLGVVQCDTLTAPLKSDQEIIGFPVFAIAMEPASVNAPDTDSIPFELVDKH